MQLTTINSIVLSANAVDDDVRRAFVAYWFIYAVKQPVCILY